MDNALMEMNGTENTASLPAKTVRFVDGSNLEQVITTILTEEDNAPEDMTKDNSTINFK